MGQKNKAVVGQSLLFSAVAIVLGFVAWLLSDNLLFFLVPVILAIVLVAGAMAYVLLRPIWAARQEAKADPEVHKEDFLKVLPSVFRPSLVLRSLNTSNYLHITIDRPVFTIGRLDCDYRFVEDNEVSSLHCSITYDAQKDKYYLVDMGSVNGTYLNEKRLKANHAAEMVIGDVVGIARYRFKVHSAYM